MLILVKQLLSERNHAVLYNNMQQVFPKLFDYEDCGILFLEDKTNQLYQINVQDTTQRLDDSNMIRYPFNIGLTGKSASSMEIIRVDKG